ncbi:GntR family transcriptional regulator [Bradyrhizobium sp. NP1]|uniref:GntR family transcriptional regulator n=1 Tax=Bradyrhizobium sp. NP1 TaxID=3049772 RepID=UPI0025A5615D|nr:GntR family transcriptional regulator [Bradyrhizobium sp. NP1]WJR77886.1 GntR family transcriptional regulator [Bradyrhizobium sp. NP1]
MNKAVPNYDRSRVPLYVQLASVMRQRIENGHWGEGEKISTIEELETEFGVARVTVRQAIEMLREEGLLDAQQGRGTFVSGKPKNKHWLNLANDFDSVINSLKNNVLKRIYVEDNADPPELRKGEAQLSPSGYAFLRSVQYNEDEPFSVVNLHLARNIFNKDRRRFTHSAALAKIMEMDDLTVAHAFQTLTIGVADPETAEHLKIGLGEPTADCRLILVDSDGVAVYVANIHYHRSCFALHADLMESYKRKR